MIFQNAVLGRNFRCLNVSILFAQNNEDTVLQQELATKF